MTEPDQQPDMPAALRLSVAIDQIIQPGVQHLDRSQPENTPEVAAIADELERDYRERRDHLRRQHQRYHARRDQAGMRRSMDAIAHLDEARAAAEVARTVATATLPSLLDQLHDAVESSSSSGGAPSAGARRSPIGLDAAELIGHIQRTTLHHGAETLAQHLRTWSEHHDRTATDADVAEQWVTQARAIVAPSRGFEAKAPCPLCGTRRVWVADETGERVQRAAIQIDYGTRTARCIAPQCVGYWTRDYLEHLARVLVQD